VCGPEQVNVLVTRDGADPRALAAFADAGSEVLIS
jgi:hypothetical protein